MPNEKVLSEKKAIVEAPHYPFPERQRRRVCRLPRHHRCGRHPAAPRARAAEVEYSVVKNTLTRFALDKVGLAGLDEVLHGTTSLATSAGDPIAPIRIVNDYAKKLGDRFNIKAAFMDGKILDAGEIEEIAALPSKDALYAKVLGTMLAPITSWPFAWARSSSRRAAPSRAPSPPAEAAAE